MTYEFHRYANIFPLMHENSNEFLNLKDSLKQTGMIVPVLLFGDKILDGRNRYRCHLEDETIELKTEQFNGTDEEALNYSLALNNTRRHLVEGQRALAAIRLSEVQSGMKTIEGQKWASEIFGVSLSLVRMAFDITRSHHSEKNQLLEMIELDDIAISAAHNILKNLPPEKWEQAALSDKNAKQWIKEVKRNDNELKFANKTVAANRALENDTMLYGVIYIDPPWRFEVRSENGMDRSAENHYPTMTLDDIRGMKIPAADDCVMFLWATVPHLNNAIEILEGWGFTYKSAYFWHKTKPGLGYWSANTMEVLLLGVKGEIPAPLPEQRMDQVIKAEQGKHSEKPEVFADGITKMFPNVAKVDMFARKRSHKGDNWYYHGNEVGEESEETTAETKNRKPRNGNGNGRKKAAEIESSSEQEETPQ